MRTDNAVGVDSFAYHRWFGEWNRWETPLDTSWTTVDLLDRVCGMGCDVVSVQTRYLEHMDRSSMRWLAAEAADRNLDLVLAWGHRSGLQGGTSPERFEDAMTMVGLASEAEVRLLRVVCGDQTSWAESPRARSDRLGPMLSVLSRRAADAGIAIAVENHADFTIKQLSDLVDRVGEPNLGVCFDVGNAVRVGDDPVDAARRVAPLTRLVHMKDMLVQPESVGDPALWWPTVPLGSGELPLVQVVTELQASTHLPPLLVEMANMHPSFPDEDSAVESSVRFLRSTTWR